MKILQIAPQVPYPLSEGGRISIYNISKYLALRGHQIDFVCYQQQSDLESAYKALKEYTNPTILPVRTNNSVYGAIANFFSPVPYNISKYKTKALRDFLKNYFQSNRPDIIHVDHLHMAWVIDLIRELSSAPVVLRQHNVEGQIMRRFYEKQRNPLLKAYSRLQYFKFITYEPGMCKKFSLCAAITGEDERTLKKMDNSIQTCFIPAGVEKQLLKIEKPGRLIPYSIFHIGSLKWLPNIDAVEYFFAKIFPLVLEQEPESKFYIYGRGAEELPIPVTLRHAVIVIGYVDDIWPAINDKIVGVAPLRIGGGMRLKVVELMAAGKLLVSTTIAKEGIPVVDGENGFVADDPKEFAKRILACLRNPDSMQSLIDKGRALIRQEYTWESVVKRFEDEYLTLIANNRRISEIKG
jgi:glycosyltransferase involved in cell wall biosynthesis